MVLDTAVIMKLSGMSGKLVVVPVIVVVPEVPELLVADNTNVYDVPDNNPYSIMGEPSVDIFVMLVPPPVGVIVNV